METYTQEGWQTAKRRYSCRQNGHGHWWPWLEIRTSVHTSDWYPTNIRNSNPFKTLKGAIRYVESVRARLDKSWGKDEPIQS